MKIIAHYSIGEETEDTHTVDVIREIAEKFPRMVAEEAAEDYHANHDGWEDDWPLNINLHDADGSVIEVFEVDRQAVPMFTASSIS